MVKTPYLIGLLGFAIFVSYPAVGVATGTVKSGNDQCDYDQLIIHGKTELKLEREGDGYVDVTDPHVAWTCHNANGSNDDGSVDCPSQTNQFHAHRQKRDNSEWLWDCQVK